MAVLSPRFALWSQSPLKGHCDDWRGWGGSPAVRNPGIRTLGTQGPWDGTGDGTARAWGLQKAKGTDYLTVLRKTTASSKRVISVGKLEDGSRRRAREGLLSPSWICVQHL